MGAILLNAQALALTAASGGIALSYSGSFGNQANVVNGYNNTRIFTAISGGDSFELNSQENVTSDFVFVRPQNAEFNYTTNPSFISGSTGEVLYSTSINNPQVYITTVGMYNDANELLAVAKLSRPLVKDFTKEALIRVKLDF
jgi:outer membrane lipoprotein-sorting protein